MTDVEAKPTPGEAKTVEFDVAVVGAGFAGLYLLHRLRAMGLSTVVIERGSDVGGTWFWNRYPGARCDIQSIDYSYSFDAELEAEWQWSEKYATQPEILSYLEHVADRFDLRSDIQFSTSVDQATWDDDASRWRLRTDAGDEITSRFYVMATGCLSVPKSPDIAGIESFEGEIYSTSRWPHEGVDFSGKRVGVIGTGSSGIQCIPLIAEQAEALTVFQRTATFTFPAGNGPHRQDKLETRDADRDAYHESAKWSRGGVPSVPTEIMTFSVSDEERLARYEEVWEAGDLIEILGAFADTMVSEEANGAFVDFIHGKIRSIVNDPDTAEALCPTTYPVGTKRPCLDSGYFETFNLPHVSLVDLRADPIVTTDADGIITSSGAHQFDAIVLATGFDAMTGAIVGVDVVGRDGVSLKEKWADGPTTYLGLTTAGFPNFFTITGPSSPSVLSNMTVSIEQHADLVCDTVAYMGEQGLDVIEPTEVAEAGWRQHVTDFSDITLYPKANSWYMGSNVPGKPRVFLAYVGGVDVYRGICDEMVAKGYLGFRFQGADGERCNDGVIRTLAPDVGLMVEFIDTTKLPAFEDLPLADSRAMYTAFSAERPPGPEVGEIVDGVFPGADGDLAYRLYRPATEGPHPVVAYFHGGGWVFGSADADDPLCRDLCVRSNSIIVSFDYRHAPEARFPAAAEDGLAAVQWLADNAESLGAIAGKLAVAGWSAGGNVAAVVCQMARDADGPAIAGQALMTPVVDFDMSRPSFTDNADGFVLTASTMRWFWDSYADEADRSDPRASPLQGDLAGLPPAIILTSEFDPLRDEGNAYAAALSEAGVSVRHVQCRGQIHTSLQAVDVILSGAYARAEMADAIQDFFK